MTAKDIVAELKKLGNAQTKKTWMTHGALEPCLGVKVEDMKKIQKRLKMDYQICMPRAASTPVILEQSPGVTSSRA